MGTLSSRAGCIGESQTTATRTKARALQGAGAAVANLAAGEPDYDTSESIRRAAHLAVDAGPHRYTDSLGLVKLREAVAEA
ncbi:MAG TPA: aspartate transaminase, partial [Methylomirabilota bacterium]|nr:aspartate transaminase [Methylomirabilota bacterium]